ncbi:MAG: phage baseplate assembly protein V [Cyanobacteria bacterium J06635_1]
MTTANRVSLHFARVSQIDLEQCRARVELQELGMESYWLPVGQYRTGNNTAYWMPSVGEMIAALLDEQGESGVIFCGIYTAANGPPASDGDLLAIGTGKVTIDADVEITGDITINGVTTMNSTGNNINGSDICVIGGTDSAGHLNQVSGQ